MKAIFLILPVILSGFLMASCQDDSMRSPPVENVDLTNLFLTGTDYFPVALVKEDFLFPRDHGPHPDHRTEWWYLTGNLTSGSRQFGFQLTFFRLALDINPAVRRSKWASNQIYMAHFALTDVNNASFYNFERFSRDALGLAGASSEPFRVWVENWAVEGLFPMSVKAGTETVGIALTIQSGKPMVKHGDNGYSRKSANSASHYYSFPRLPVNGQVQLQGQVFEVEGIAWFDREWSNGSLSKEQVGWNWFALQFNNNTELMLYELRRRDNLPDPFTYGVLVTENSRVRKLKSEDISIQPLRYWESPFTGVTYPVEWQINVPSLDMSLRVAAKLDDQEHRNVFQYWEGSTSVEGGVGRKVLSGQGYVELTGYSQTGNF